MQGHCLQNTQGVEGPDGIVRRTLVHNEQAMLCHFELKKGATIPLHNHAPAQIGYVLSGRVKFISDRHPDGFVVEAGDSYVFDPHESHGAEALEDTCYIEVFSPSRPEYA